MRNINTIIFLTGTRADYGKLKPLIKKTEKVFDTHIFICGMHLLPEYGNTYKDILKDDYKNIYCANNIELTGKMDIDLANTIINLNSYINIVKPDLIVVHGDRIDALAGAISGMLNNILIAHVEGGEITGTVDEAIRHSITKMAQFHFVANYESKLRILQLGEKEENIYVIGSPDIDIMLSELPPIEEVKERYNIGFSKYAILMYHPVTTEVESIEKNIQQVLKAIEDSDRNYIVIYPNNDLGSNIIIKKFEKLKHNSKCRVFASLPFEDFLSLLKDSQFIIGNSSAGIREACVYGIPAIDIGTRQNGRYQKAYLRNIQHTTENYHEILNCINQTIYYRFASNHFGDGRSSDRFVNILKSEKAVTLQKKFIHTSETKEAIENYINEVCF
ncbi:UDP-N-acetylglucosamine 2-epimerase [Clostridium botulinum]|uniref:UDP-N-acetylglucosamine 2-epimerase n=1 Tax=Clostridium botulinum TaxID=1491 RepID=UPI0018D274B3|nr:UDP-N-acetylglucosamine 2-epimerase [Clostridium botulinum]